MGTRTAGKREKGDRRQHLVPEHLPCARHSKAEEEEDGKGDCGGRDPGPKEDLRRVWGGYVAPAPCRQGRGGAGRRMGLRVAPTPGGGFGGGREEKEAASTRGAVLAQQLQPPDALLPAPLPHGD